MIKLFRPSVKKISLTLKNEIYPFADKSTNEKELISGTPFSPIRFLPRAYCNFFVYETHVGQGCVITISLLGNSHSEGSHGTIQTCAINVYDDRRITHQTYDKRSKTWTDYPLVHEKINLEKAIKIIKEHRNNLGVW